jgi:electron transfer flavoprotein-quinone oxidoreductase
MPPTSSRRVGFNALGKLYGDGILVSGDAAGFALNIGFTVRGMEYALASGYYAAQAVIKARENNDFSAGSFSVYQRMLEESFVLKDFKNFREAPSVVANPRLAVHYPELVGRIMSDVYSIPAGPKDRIYPTVKKHLSAGEMWELFKDLRGMMKI